MERREGFDSDAKPSFSRYQAPLSGDLPNGFQNTEKSNGFDPQRRFNSQIEQKNSYKQNEIVNVDDTRIREDNDFRNQQYTRFGDPLMPNNNIDSTKNQFIEKDGSLSNDSASIVSHDFPKGDSLVQPLDHRIESPSFPNQKLNDAQRSPSGFRGPPPDDFRGLPPDGFRGPPPDNFRGPPPEFQNQSPGYFRATKQLPFNASEDIRLDENMNKYAIDNSSSGQRPQSASFNDSELLKDFDTLGSVVSIKSNRLCLKCSSASLDRSESQVQDFFCGNTIRILGCDIPPPIFHFDEAPFPNEILKALEESGYDIPTPIQAVAMPAILSGRDIVGVAKTGSGKTATYVLPSLIHIKQQKNVQGPHVLVLCPTRELIQQIDEVVRKFGTPYNISCACIFGGEGNRRDQIAKVSKKPDIIAAVPGRLLDLVKNKFLDLSNITMLIIDEADKMLDMNFDTQIKCIVSRIQKDRHTLMWSATWPKSVRDLAKAYLNDDNLQIVVDASDLTVNPNIYQVIEKSSDFNRFDTFLNIVQKIQNDTMGQSKIIVFAKSKKEVDDIAQELSNKKIITCFSIHGGKDQKQRSYTLSLFRSTKYCALIGTDLLSRGLDVTDVTHVINYQMPPRIEDYIHRIGRTARATRTGVAISIFTNKDAIISRKLVKIITRAKQTPPTWLVELAESTPADAYKNSIR